MSGVKGIIAHGLIGKFRVEPFVVATQEYAKEGGQTHRDEHVDRSFLCTKTRVMGKESKEWNFNTSMMEDTC